MSNYMIEQVTEYNKDLQTFLKSEVPNISKMFGDKFNFNSCALGRMLSRGIFLVCKRNGEITGILVAFLSPSIFDVETKILQQQLFYVKPDSGRTAFHLFKKFIDIGRSKADHIITMLTSQTNIKSQTLENMGFKELETLYRLEV